MANPWDNDPVVGGKTSSPAEFAKVYGGAAKTAGDALGVDSSVILGQWGLETGWGKSIIPGTNNLGNIKDFSRAGTGVAATDNMNGSKDKYRAYATPDDFARDYASLIGRKYPGARNAGKDPAKFTAGLKGYAEDPRYPEKVAQASRMAGGEQNPIVRGLNAVAGAILPSAQAATQAKGNPWDNDPVVDAPQAAPAPARAPVSHTEALKANPSYQAGAGAGGPLRGLLSGIQGPLMGFGDEIVGALGAPLKSLVNGQSVADNYREGRDFARGAQDSRQKEDPWGTGITQVMASAPLGALKLFAAPAAGQKLGILAQTGQAAATGAGYGAAAGAGNSTATTVGGLAKDTAVGGAVGAALSGAAVPVGQAIAGAGRNVGSRFSDRIAAKHAQEKIAEAVVRDASGTLARGASVNPMAQAGRRLDRLGGGAVIADSAGQSTRSLLDLLASLPGRTKDTAATLLRTRKNGEAKGMIAAAEGALGTGGRRLASTIDELTVAQKTAAAPLYNQLRQTTVTPSPALEGIVKAADDLGAVKLGREMATARQQPFSLNTGPAPLNPLGQPSVKQWTMNDLDQVKRGLDQQIAKEWDDIAGRLTPRGAAFQDLKRKLVAELDTATTDPQTGASLYKAARNAFAGPASLIDAARMGQKSITQGEAAITQSIKGMSLSEQEAFRVGAFEALREKIGRSQGGRTELMNMAENPAIAEKLKVIFGSTRAYREFAASAAKSKVLKQLQGTGQGSKTFERQYAAGDLDVSAMREAGTAATSAASGNLLGAAAAVGGMWNRVKTPEAVRDEMGRILLTGGAQGKNELAAMLELTQRINSNRAAAAAGAGTGVGIGLNSFGPR